MKRAVILLLVCVGLAASFYFACLQRCQQRGYADFALWRGGLICIDENLQNLDKPKPEIMEMEF
jgi:hypothetical protein